MNEAGLKIKQVFLLLLLFPFSINSLLAQSPEFLLNELETKFPQEKIYVHYDRPYYNPGETIWFKAYLISGFNPSSISQTMYAELLNEKGNLIQRKVIPVFESGAASHFDLGDSLQDAKLFVRAYTSWMLNFDPALIYIQPVSIIRKPSSHESVKLPQSTITFFPQAGDLVNNLTSTVAFQAADQSGMPVTAEGTIKDSKGNILTTFKSVHDGRGTFLLTPTANESYSATWKDNIGKTYVTNLPVTKANGISLSVNMLSTPITYTIERSDVADSTLKSLFVIAQMQQQAVYSAKVNLSVKTKSIAPLIIDSLANGILQLTVFSSNHLPIAERIIFIDNNNYQFGIKVNVPAPDLNKRKLNVLHVDLQDTILSNLSISITDESLSPSGQNSNNIYSNILLTSDLKGYVYNPAYYFSSSHDSIKLHRDLVMMTNGWRRFKWQDIIAGKWPDIKYSPEKYLTIHGRVKGTPGTVFKDREITGILKPKSGKGEMFIMPVKEDGTFHRPDVYFFDTAQLFYQFNNDKNKRLTTRSSFAFEPNFLKNIPLDNKGLTSYPLSEKPDSITLNNNLKNAHIIFEADSTLTKMKSLETVVVSARRSRERELEEEYASGLFRGGDAYSFSTDNASANTATSILNYLQGRVAGLQIEAGGTGVSWRGSATTLFLNEMTTDLTSVEMITMNDVALIKVFRPPFFGAPGAGSGGAIAIYLKKGQETSSFSKGLDYVNITGYSAIREFYSPDYEKLKDSVPLHDYRSTLYWNPYIIMDKNNRRVSISFYNSDNCKKLRIIVEGINKQGLLTRSEQIFQ